MAATANPDAGDDTEDTLDIDGVPQLDRGDALLDTRTHRVKHFHHAEVRDDLVETVYAHWETWETEAYDRFEEERETSIRAKLGRTYKTAEEFPLPVADHTRVGAWLLTKVEKDRLAEWRHGRYTLTVGKGYKTNTRADYGVELSRPALEDSGETGPRTECIYRGDTFEQVLAGAVRFMKEVEIDELGDDDHAFGFFRLGKVEAPLYPEDISEGDIVEFHQMVTEMTMDGKKQGERKGDDTYIGEVISKTEDTLHIAKHNSFDASTAVINYDQLAAKLV